MDAQLLEIVEVDPAERVLCHAEGCGRGVYRRIHVVRCDDGVVRAYGSDCFDRLFHGLMTLGKPRYSNGAGRRLSPEDRALLVANTEALVAQFEEEYQLEATRELERQQRQQQLQRADAERAEAARQQAQQREAQRRGAQRTHLPTDAELATVELEAKDIVREKYGVDPNAPGWRGLVLKHARELLGKA